MYELRQGFLTVEGGHRIGIAGKTVIEGEKVKGISHISCINVRVAHEKKGCADRVMPYLWEDGRFLHTLIVSAPGCGKTTIMRLIARLYKPTGGSITQYIDEKFKQKPKGSKAWYKKVGVVYQNPDYQLFMPTVRQEISFGAKSEAYAAEIAALFGVKYLWERHPQSLSEGQKRRVSIAAVAACEPEVLLLDEPTVGQDYDGLCAMVEILNKLHKQSGNTMITITHDVRCAEALCDRAYLIESGIVAKRGGKELVKEYFMI